MTQVARCTLYALALSLMSVPAGAQEAREPGLRFHASFDRRDVAADFALGNPQSTTFTESLELRAVPGVAGPAFQIAADELLEYDLPGNFSLTGGTVLMWVQPVNWAGRNDRFEMFFRARSPQYVLYLYKYSQPNHLFAYINVGGEKVIARTSIEDWQPERWHQIAAAWNQSVLRLYLDGEKVHEVAVPEGMELPEASEGSLSITPPRPWEKGFDPEDRTIVDEVRIYDHPLEDAEIRRDYLRLAPQQADSGPLALRYEIDSVLRCVHLNLDAFRLTEDGGEEPLVTAALSDAAGAVLAQRQARTEGGLAALDLPFGELAPGQYTLTARALDAAGEELATASASFQRPEVTWADAPQFEHTVPEPWTPVAGDVYQARVYGREYRFGEGPLPTAIVSDQGAILSAPARLEVAGAEPAWQPATLVAHDPEALRRTGQGRAGEIAFTWESAVEFDGMMRCDLTLEPVGERTQVSGLRLVIPVAAEQGQYVLTPLLTPWGDDGRIALEFRDLVWLTGRRAGLCWFAESDANWVSGEAPPLSIERGPDATTLSIELIGAPVSIEGPVRYTFGLQATPVRQLTEGWRNLNFGTPRVVEGTRHFIAAQGGGAFRFNAWLEVREGADMNAALERWRGWGAQGLPYSTPTYIADHNEIFDFYQLEWRNSERHCFTGYKTPEGLEYALRAVCPRSNFSELMVHWADGLFAGYPELGGIYFDCCSPTSCRNERHGCGGVDAFGRAYRTSPIFDLRDILRRVYTTVHACGGMLINHAHSFFYPPCHGFSDYWFPGEQYTTRLGENLWYYTDVLSPEVWQIELNSQLRGVGVQFLPEYGRGTDKRFRDEETAPSRSLLAAATVHDVPVSGHWINPGEIATLWAIFDRYDLSQAAFHGYWEEDCPVSADAPLLASVYQGGDTAVIVVSNLTPEQAAGTLRVDAASLGVGEGWTMSLQPGDQAITASVDAIPVAVPARDFRVITIAP